MIRALAHYPDGKPIVMFGLTAENLERMIAEEQPIVVNLNTIDPELPDVAVTIFYASATAIAAMQERFQGNVHTEGEPSDGDDNNGGGNSDRDTTGNGASGRNVGNAWRRTQGAKRRGR